MPDFTMEPVRIKMVERIRATTRAEREAILDDAGLNLFRVAVDGVTVARV